MEFFVRHWGMMASVLEVCCAGQFGDIFILVTVVIYSVLPEINWLIDDVDTLDTC